MKNENPEALDTWRSLVAAIRSVPPNAQPDLLAQSEDPFEPFGKNLTFLWSCDSGKKNSVGQPLGNGESEGLPSALPFEISSVLQWFGRNGGGAQRLVLTIVPPDRDDLSVDTTLQLFFWSPVRAVSMQATTPFFPQSPSPPAPQQNIDSLLRAATERAEARAEAKAAAREIEQLKERLRDTETRLREAERDKERLREMVLTASQQKQTGSQDRLLEMMIAQAINRNPTREMAETAALLRTLQGPGETPQDLVSTIADKGIEIVKEMKGANSSEFSAIVSEFAKRGVDANKLLTILHDEKRLNEIADYMKADE